MNDILVEMKSEIAHELAGTSAYLKSYVSTLEARLHAAESDLKGHWMYYCAVAFVSAMIGHYV